jgi:uncharacterized protein (DUF1499 family)
MHTASAPPRRSRRARLFQTILLVAALGAAAMPIGAQMGWFSGTRPQDIGYNAGKFKPCAASPNCVSSTGDAQLDPKHHIAPLRVGGDPAEAWRKLETLLKATPRVVIVRADGGYLHAEFSSKLMGYVDDVEFALDATARVIHVRSASRLGESDFGVNRARIEEIRARIEP